MRKRPLALLALLALPAGTLLWSFRSRPRPNVILVTLDSLRPDHLLPYGYKRLTSPTLARLAREGAVFTNAVSSSSWTLPAHAALFTGLPDSVHGCVEDDRWLPRNRETLAERFREAGYETVGFFSGPYLHPAFGLSQGFEAYHDCTSYSRKTIAVLQKGRMEEDLFALSHEDITNPILLREVTRWAARPKDRPFFLFLHMWDIHYDYIPPPPYDRLFDPDYEGPADGRGMVRKFTRPPGWTDRDVAHVRALYDGEIRVTDETLGRILGVLRERGLLENTLVVVTADHGEAFYEHGIHGHRHTLFEEEIRIPLILWAPGQIPAGVRIAAPVHLTDIAPTVLAFCGLEPLPLARGRDLRPLLQNADAFGERVLVSELLCYAFRNAQVAIRKGRWKVVKNLVTGRERVYDLLADPRELAPLRPEEVPRELEGLYRRVAEELAALRRALPFPSRRDTPPIDRMTEAQLRRLGYLK